jgi:Ni/Co efflux regulator RcnB
MSKLSLIALAASAAFLPMAAAQAQQGAASGSTRVGMPTPHQPGMRMGGQHGRGFIPPRGHHGRGFIPPRGHHGRGFIPPGGHHGRGFTHFRRIDRGGFVPHFWFGPQFHVQNWSIHGFPEPMHDRRWIRYYDDALLIDRDGRVHDGRYGWDWDRYDDRWAEDENGIPVYVGDGDFEPGDWDYEWAEGWERGDYREEDRGYAHHDGRGPPPDRCGNPCTRTYRMPPGPGYGHPGYGYGYYGWGPVIVTETIVTAPVVEQVTTYEYIEEEVRVAPRGKVKRPCNCPRPAPRPQPGERG